MTKGTNHLVRLILPVGLAVVAFVANWIYLHAGKETRSFVQIVDSVRPGNDADGESVRFTSSDLQKLTVIVTEGDEIRAVPWEDSVLLEGTTIQRPYEPGDLVLLDDVAREKKDLNLAKDEKALVIPLSDLPHEPALLTVGRYVGFVVEQRVEGESPLGYDEESYTRKIQLGPFRLVSVGPLVEELIDQGGDGSSNRISTISVATKLQEGGYLSEEASLLLDAAREEEILGLTHQRLDHPQSIDTP